MIEEKYDIWLSKISKFIPKEDAREVLNIVLLSLIERNFSFDGYICPDCYIINACKIQYWSKNSTYNRQMGNQVNKVEIDEEVIKIDDPEPDPYMEIDIWKEIDNSPFCWWEKEMFKRKILEGKTLKEMSEECNLTQGQIWYSYNKIRKYLKKSIKSNA